MLVHASKLAGVDERLANVVRQAAEHIDVAVLEGLRTQTRQAKLVAAGASKTMASKHLTGKAVDLGVMVGGDVRWDWPLYFTLAEVMQETAKRLNTPVRWGGCWALLNSDASPEEMQDNRRPFLDGPHFEVADVQLSA
jgi:peptidoglycan L-alanyl-D-glutamate endopeptidase CwlK